MNAFFHKLRIWWRSEGLEKKEINYPYFLSLFSFISCLSLSHFLWMEKPLLGAPLFFLIYAIGQSILESALFTFCAYLLSRWAPRWTLYLFIVCSVYILLFHFTHFTMVRLLDATLFHLFTFLFGKGHGQIVAVIQAVNLNASMGQLIIAVCLLLPLAGLIFYWLTHHISLKKPLKLSFAHFFSSLLALIAALFLLDLFGCPFFNHHIYQKYQKLLPLGKTFLQPKAQQIQLKAPFLPPRSESLIEQQIASYSDTASSNLYFFIIETLRSDFVNEHTAPHMTCFAQDEISIPCGFSNANSTMLSWFALFYAHHPYYWTRIRSEWRGGSPALRLLKQLGYTIHVYSSADLRYFNMDQILFGEERSLPDSLQEYSSMQGLPPWKRDALVLQAFENDLLSSKNFQKRAHFFFLDSTHSEYSFPEDCPLQFTPILKEIDYLSMGKEKKELEYLKNRYRNSIFYVDSLIGQFLTLLKQHNLYDSALISITGDHGEEFFEEGALFHGTHLNTYQTHVPILLKFPNRQMPLQTQIASHIDLFPSIFHVLTQAPPPPDLFDGESLFLQKRSPYRVAVLQNGPEMPSEFSLNSSQGHLRARFVNPEHFDSCHGLEIIHMDMPGGFSFEHSLESQIETHFPHAFDALTQKKAQFKKNCACMRDQDLLKSGQQEEESKSVCGSQ